MHLSEKEQHELYRRDFDAYRAYEDEGVRTSRLREIVTPQDRRELNQAYSDSGNNAPEKLGRSLMFWSDALYTGEQLRRYMTEAIPEGYNEFGVDILDALTNWIFTDDDKVMFQPAREGSVAIYVHGMDGQELKLLTDGEQRLLKIDEVFYYPRTRDNKNSTGVVRLWWD